MTTPVLADPRRTGPESGRVFSSSLNGDGPALEMPVLFQLADVSQFKLITPPPKPKSERKSPLSTPATQPERTANPATRISEPALIKPAEPKSGTAPIEPAVGQEASNHASGALPSVTMEPALLRGVEAAIVPAETSSLDSPTIRARAELRQRRQAAAKGDWFQTQGKYIVIVFLIALGGTVFLARRGDDSPPSPAQEDGTTNVAQDHSAVQPKSEVAKTPVDLEPRLATETIQDLKAAEPPAVTMAQPAADSLVETSPADAAESSISSPVEQPGVSPPAGPSPQVTLQAPIDAGQAVPQEPDTDASLFPWTGSNGERVAARPQPPAPRSSVPMPQPNPHFQARPHAAGATSPAPSSPASTGAAANPEATLPTMPGEQAAPAAYPVTDPATYRSYLPPTPRGPAAQGTVPAAYENRVPPAPRPSGPRYERTGSGLF